MDPQLLSVQTELLAIVFFVDKIFQVPVGEIKLSNNDGETQVIRAENQEPE